MLIARLSERIHKTLSLDERAEQRLNGDDQIRSSNHFPLLRRDIAKYTEFRTQLAANRVKGYKQLLNRLCEAVAGSKELEISINRLKDLVKDLAYFSEEIYKAAQLDVSLPLPKLEELLQLNEAKHFIDSLISFVNDLYSAAVRYWPSESWALELRHPDREGDLTALHLKASINIDLVFFGSSEQPNTWRRVRIEYEHMRRPWVSPEDVIRSIVKPEEWGYPGSQCVTPLPPLDRRLGSLREGLRIQHDQISCSTKANAQLSTYRGFNPYELSELALNLGNWLFLLWGSSWSLNLCSCRIGGSRAGEELCYMLAPSCGGMVSSHHRRHHRAAGKLFLLGTVFSELALLEPLVAECIAPTERHEESGIVLRSRDVVLVSETSLEILDFRKVFSLISKERGLDYCESVKFCFDYDDKTRDRELRPEDLALFQKSVIEPWV